SGRRSGITASDAACEPWHPSCCPIYRAVNHPRRRNEMMRFLMGALAGALAMWYWGDDIRDYIENRTRDARGRAVDTLQSVETKAGEMLDRAKEQVSSTLQAGEDAPPPRGS